MGEYVVSNMSVIIKKITQSLYFAAHRHLRVLTIIDISCMHWSVKSEWSNIFQMSIKTENLDQNDNILYCFDDLKLNVLTAV